MCTRWALRWCLLGTLLSVMTPASAQFQRGWGGGNGSDVELVERFDANKNGYLDKAERYIAYETIIGAKRGKVEAQPIINGKLTPVQVKVFPQDKPLYDPLTLRTVFLTFEDNDWEAQMIAFKGTDIDVLATAVVDGKTYKNVGVHFRGNTSFREVDEGYKHSMKVSFDLVDGKQTVLGYKALELMNAAADATFLRSVLYLQLTRDYLPAPKANYMRVVINGENWGIYINSQPFGSDFVKEATGANGARWKVHGSPSGHGGLEYLGDNLDYYRYAYQITSKDKPESWAALMNLCKVLNQTPANKLEAALKPLLDVDGVLRFLAIDNTLVNNDGYWVRGSDYSIYQDKAGIFHVTPHDVNESMRPIERRGWGSNGSNSAVGLDPLISVADSSKPLLSKLLAVPALKQRYLGYVRDITNKWLDWNKVGPIAMQYQALIAQDIKADRRKLYSNEGFTAGLTQDTGGEGFGAISTSEISIKTFLEQRRAYLLNYFAGSAAKRGGA
ncbi:MAG: CotH kinase family protein [Steroidobacteraceae bacterium]